MLSRQDYIVTGTIAIVAFVCAWIRHAPGVCGITHDDAIYAILGKALAQGHGFSLIDLPGAPPQTKYPFGYPLILSVVWWINPQFPNNISIFQAISAFGTAIWVWLSALLLIRFQYTGRAVAYASALVCATSPYVAWIGSQTLSDMPFAPLFVLSLWIAERRIAGAGILPAPSAVVAPFKEFVDGVLLAIPYSVRALGAPVLLVTYGWLLIKRRLPIWLALGTAMVVVPWLAFSLVAKPAATASHLAHYYNSYFDWWAAHESAPLPAIVFGNLCFGSFSLAKLPIAGFWTEFGIDSNGLMLAACALLGMALWVPLIVRVKTKRVLPIVIAVYLLVLLIWPWPPSRVLTPLFIFLFAFLFEDLAKLGSRLKRTTITRSLAGAMVAVLVVTNMALLWRDHEITRATGFSYPDLPRNQVSWQSFINLTTWVRAHVPPSETVASNIDSLVYLYSGVHAYKAFITDPAHLFYGGKLSPVGTPDQLIGLADSMKTKYLVFGSMCGYPEEADAERLLTDLRSKYASRLKLVYSEADPHFVVFELTKPLYIDPAAIKP